MHVAVSYTNTQNTSSSKVHGSLLSQSLSLQMENVSQIMINKCRSTLDNVHPMTFHSFVRQRVCLDVKRGPLLKHEQLKSLLYYTVRNTFATSGLGYSLRNNIDVSMDVRILCGWLTV